MHLQFTSCSLGSSGVSSACLESQTPLSLLEISLWPPALCRGSAYDQDAIGALPACKRAADPLTMDWTQAQGKPGPSYVSGLVVGAVAWQLAAESGQHCWSDALLADLCLREAC